VLLLVTPAQTETCRAAVNSADAYHNSISYSRLSHSASQGAAAAGSAAAAAVARDDGFLDGVPDLAAKSSLSKDVQKERGLTTNKLGIAGARARGRLSG
jgi:hypothetical protein